MGRQHLRGGSVDPRHRHRAGYLFIVIEGELEEAGEEGRIRAGPGDVLVHRPFDAHCNSIGSRGVKLLNLHLLDDFDLPPFAHVEDADSIVRLAERDALEASEAAADMMVAKDNRSNDWPDLLADHLRRPGGLSLHDWADRARLAPETLSRGFNKLYRVSPARYRLEYRARLAWRQIVETADPLADIALECGFADQPHMCRAVRAVTGSTPSTWRLAVTSAEADRQSCRGGR